jgi:two-component system cell cycle response regulator
MMQIQTKKMPIILFSCILIASISVISIVWLQLLLCITILLLCYQQWGIHQLQQQCQQLALLSQYDSLTKVYNRCYLEQHLRQEWYRLLRLQQPLTIIMLDIDRFKTYNDCYGHVRGDKYLRIVAKLLQRSLKRATDLVARYGGEEFVIVLPHINAEGAAYIGHKISKTMQRYNIALSIGSATFIPSHQQTINTILDRADQAMYQAKKQGGNCYLAASPATMIPAKPA